jgi:hypothetical protein
MRILINMLSPDCGAFIAFALLSIFICLSYCPGPVSVFKQMPRTKSRSAFPILKMLGLQYSKPVDRDKMTGRCRLTGSYRITGRCSLTDRVRVTGRRRLPYMDCPTDRYGLTN